MKKVVTLLLPLGLIALAALFYFLDPTKNVIFPRCAFNSLTGYYCPGCGSQRAIHNLLHFNIIGVAGNNLLVLPAILLILYHYSRWPLKRFFNLNLPNIFYFKKTPWIILVVIVLFWILRNIPAAPFNYLAPG